jgi:SAM-dependent methyltransferase
MEPLEIAATTSADYVTDVTYVRNFCFDLNPLILASAIALNGFAPPKSVGFDYCEVGCGTADTLVAIAAACPTSRFVGIDLNPDHIAIARNLAKRSQVTNIRFYEGDFQLIDDGDLPSFDFIAAHGFLSWVAPPIRDAVMAFASRKLVPGGALFTSYNALPAWAAIGPLRRLLLESSSGIQGSLARAQTGLAVLEQLSTHGAEYFVQNPNAREMLATMKAAGPNYIAHEYLHREWHPMYFADIAHAMGKHDLHFAGQLPLQRNVAELTFPATMLELAQKLNDRLALETLKDYATNEFLRGDIFVKGGRPPQDSITVAYAENTRFGTIVGEARIAREVRLPHFILRYDEPIFDTLIPRLANNPASMQELSLENDFAQIDRDTLRKAILRLLVVGQLVPMPHDAPTSAIEHNRAVIQEGWARREPVILAMTPGSAAITVSHLQTLAMHLVSSNAPKDRAQAVRDFVSQHPLKLWEKDRAVTDKAEQLALIEGEVRAYESKDHAKMIALGIVPRDP